MEDRKEKKRKCMEDRKEKKKMCMKDRKERKRMCIVYGILKGKGCVWKIERKRKRCV